MKSNQCAIKEAIICEREFIFLDTLDSDSKKLGYYFNQMIDLLLKGLRNDI